MSAAAFDLADAAYKVVRIFGNDYHNDCGCTACKSLSRLTDALNAFNRAPLTAPGHRLATVGDIIEDPGQRFIDLLHDRRCSRVRLTDGHDDVDFPEGSPPRLKPAVIRMLAAQLSEIAQKFNHGNVERVPHEAVDALKVFIAQWVRLLNAGHDGSEPATPEGGAQ